jgi:hypothetical protein
MRKKRINVLNNEYIIAYHIKINKEQSNSSCVERTYFLL